MAIDFHGFPLSIAHHEAAVSRLPDVYEDGRNLRDGYTRALGIHFGNLNDLCMSDEVFMEALELARRLKSPVSEHQLANLYLIIRYGMQKIKPGHIVEFGTHRGGSALFLARLAHTYLPHANVYCFDSFVGMPETSANDVHKRGDFSDRTEHEFMLLARNHGLDNMVVVKGFFSETVPNLVPDDVALAHIDCDLYLSVSSCYDGVKPKLVPRAYIAFDDPLFSSCIGAFDAVAEFVIKRDGLKIEQNFPNLIFRGPG